MITIHALEYTLTPQAPLRIDFWVGALLRNNLLYAASAIAADHGQTLLEAIQQTDPLLPRGYALQCEPLFHKTRLTPGEPLNFRILLFGRFGAYADVFHAAVEGMCRRGFGHPMVPMRILTCRAYTNDAPIGIPRRCRTLTIDFVTPVSLYNCRSSPQARRTSLDMQNGMPGLYFTIRALARRMNKLQYAYEDGEGWSEEQVDEWCREAREAQLEACSLSRLVLEGPPRKGAEHPIFFKGYVGRSSYSGLPDRFLPLLWTGMDTNVGNDVVYGLGQYRLSGSND